MPPTDIFVASIRSDDVEEDGVMGEETGEYSYPTAKCAS